MKVYNCKIVISGRHSQYANQESDSHNFIVVGTRPFLITGPNDEVLYQEESGGMYIKIDNRATLKSSRCFIWDFDNLSNNQYLMQSKLQELNLKKYWV